MDFLKDKVVEGKNYTILVTEDQKKTSIFRIIVEMIHFRDALSADIGEAQGEVR